MNPTPPDDVTELLGRLGAGDQDVAARLMPLIYEELHAIAERMFRRERSDHTLQATALVHEAYLRMVDQSRMQWKSRSHFLGIAAEMIRRILVDHARSRQTLKRGGDRTVVTLAGDEGGVSEPNLDLLDLDAAMHELAALHERQAKVVELRFFGGLNIDETAEVLNIAPRTVKEDWRIARAWLRRRMAAE